jgi:hypothetical protein
MTEPSLPYRLMLRAYPRSFRDHYGDEMVRTLQDMRLHGGMSRAHFMLRVTRDVVLTAPRSRMEALVTQTKVLSVLALAMLTALALVAGSPRFVVLIVVPVVLLAVLAHRHDRPITRAVRSEHWWRWAVSGVAILGTLIIAEGAGPDFDWLPGIWFLLWFFALMGLAFLAVGSVLCLAHVASRARRRTAG